MIHHDDDDDDDDDGDDDGESCDMGCWYGGMGRSESDRREGASQGG